LARKQTFEQEYNDLMTALAGGHQYRTPATFPEVFHRVHAFVTSIIASANTFCILPTFIGNFLESKNVVCVLLLLVWKPHWVCSSFDSIISRRFFQGTWHALFTGNFKDENAPVINAN